MAIITPVNFLAKRLLRRLLRRDNLEQVATSPLDYSAYQGIVSDNLYQEVLDQARPLRGLRVAAVNATSYGGGVAEIMKSFIPLMQSIGIDARWYAMPADEEFFRVTKDIHNGLQGAPVEFSGRDQEIYLRQNEKTARLLKKVGADVIEIHDPQPLAVSRFFDLPPSIWRCHIDTSTPFEPVWDFIRPFISDYDELIFTMPEFVRGSLWLDKLNFIAPTIDPLTTKNKSMPLASARKALKRLGINPRRPLITQVSRFDPWKDPQGVIDSYRLVKKKIPQVQLALVGSMAYDDPQGEVILREVERHAAGDPDIFIFTNLTGVGEAEVNAFQTASDVVIQKSLREGFGLTVTEAMWKGKPVVGGAVGGIPLQIKDGETGFLASTVEECAEKTLWFLRHREESQLMGGRARQYVRTNFLHPRLLLDYLYLYHKLAKNN